MEKSGKTIWIIDPAHSEINFKVRHMMISTVSGHFEKFDARVETNGEDFANAHVELEVDISSINTKNKDRDTHLRSTDFFDAEQHPKMTFVSKNYDGEKLTGDLTIRGTTREVELDVEFNGIAVDPYGQTKAGFEITGEINRKDFGLNWNAVTEAGNVVVSDKVKLVIEAQFIKQA
ncbi:MAG: YceI family protein [Bacteroidota bacterium]